MILYVVWIPEHDELKRVSLDVFEQLQWLFAVDPIPFEGWCLAEVRIIPR